MRNLQNLIFNLEKVHITQIMKAYKFQNPWWTLGGPQVDQVVRGRVKVDLCKNLDFISVNSDFHQHEGFSATDVLVSRLG